MQDLLPSELKYRLPEAVREEIQGLADIGWTFTKDYWESGHNGDPYNDVKFQSPAMSKAASIGEYDWNTRITKKELLEREAESVACSWLVLLKHDLDVFSPATKKLKSYFLKRKSCDFKELKNSQPTVIVKISPKIKSKPNKVRVTVEIL
jgi:hypothetical protein